MSVSPLSHRIQQIRDDFPILHQEIQGRPLIYLDNAATTQKPLAVLDASRTYYEDYNANIHRGTHRLSQLATKAHEDARETIARHLNAPSADEVIFTSGCTDSINLVANILSLSGRIGKGDEVVISGLEHHSNIVPWQMLCQATGASLKVIPVLESGCLNLEAAANLIGPKTKILAVNQISNAFGTINPIRQLIAMAKAVDAFTLIDGAQAAPHLAIDVQELGCDFYVFSGHKVYAPTGIGILWGKREWLEVLPPWRGGGEMIREVTFEHTTYNDLPFKYEAGTPNIEGGIALAAAFDYLNKIGIEKIQRHEEILLSALNERLTAISGIQIYAQNVPRAGVASFNLEGAHSYDVGTLLDQMGIAVRTGHHCCQPLMAKFCIPGTIRASLALYNTLEEVHAFGDALERAKRMLL